MACVSGETSFSPAGSGLILGIESSCDETAASVVRAGEQVLSNVVASQVTLHATYGGVVPELASREHLRNIVPVTRAAMAEAGLRLEDLDAIAVTEGPGLAGALLVGILYAKALAFGLGKPLIAVNHLEGHIHAVIMESRRPGRLNEFPLLALVVSGGHTHLYLAETIADGTWRYRNVGRTVDDAAGEAYDKVAKLLGLGYPGGPWMDALAPMAILPPFALTSAPSSGGSRASASRVQPSTSPLAASRPPSCATCRRTVSPLVPRRDVLPCRPFQMPVSPMRSPCATRRRST